MNFGDSQVLVAIIGTLGVIIGALIAGLFTWFAQRSETRRQNKQFAHDFNVRREQFAHEREEEIRGRRTEALADFQILLEAQATALGNLWGFIQNPQHPALKKLLEDAWTVLRSRGYRKKLWPIDVPITKAVNEYVDAIDKLLNDPKVRALVAGDDVKPDPKVVDDLNRQFQAASDRLKTTLKETANLMSELNDIKVRKMINQQAPVEEDLILRD